MLGITGLRLVLVRGECDSATRQHHHTTTTTRPPEIQEKIRKIGMVMDYYQYTIIVNFKGYILNLGLVCDYY